jgi:hypothetical protein
MLVSEDVAKIILPIYRHLSSRLQRRVHFSLGTDVSEGLVACIFSSTDNAVL